MKISLISLTLTLSLISGMASAAVENCSVELALNVTLDFQVDIAAERVTFPALPFDNCKTTILSQNEIDRLREFSASDLGKEFQEEYDVILDKKRAGQDLTFEEVEFVNNVGMFLEKAVKLNAGDRILKCQNNDMPVGITWGTSLKTVDIYSADMREIVTSHPPHVHQLPK